MSWIITKPSSVYKNKIMYLSDITDENISWNHNNEKALTYDNKQDAKKVITENELSHCHVLPY